MVRARVTCWSCRLSPTPDREQQNAAPIADEWRKDELPLSARRSHARATAVRRFTQPGSWHLPDDSFHFYIPRDRSAETGGAQHKGPRHRQTCELVKLVGELPEERWVESAAPSPLSDDALDQAAARYGTSMAHPQPFSAISAYPLDSADLPKRFKDVRHRPARGSSGR